MTPKEEAEFERKMSARKKFNATIYIIMGIIIFTLIVLPPSGEISDSVDIPVDTPADTPIDTPVETPVETPVSELAAEPSVSKTMIDMVHRRGTNFEIEQASSAIWYAETFQDKYVCESGVALSYYAPLDEFTTCTWIRAPSGEMTFFEPIGDDYLTYTESEWYDMFSGDKYKVTSIKEGKKWLEALGTTW